MDPSAPGSRLDADHPENGVLIPCRITAKYADHTPLYRQAQIYARQSITLDRSTLADWVGRAAFALRPVRARLLEQLKQSTKLFADENDGTGSRSRTRARQEGASYGPMHVTCGPGRYRRRRTTFAERPLAIARRTLLASSSSTKGFPIIWASLTPARAVRSAKPVTNKIGSDGRFARA